MGVVLISSCASGSIKDKERRTLKTSAAAAAAAAAQVIPATHLINENIRRTNSSREKSLRQMPTSPLAAGILRQHSVATPAGSLVQRTVTPQRSCGGGANNPSVLVCHVGGCKSKPPLTRQVAIQDETYAPAACSSKSVSFDAGNVHQRDQSASSSYCPLHAPAGQFARLHGVWESCIEEDEECQQGERPHDSDADEQKLYEAVVSIYTNRDKNRLGLAGFVPRKLSTISSVSCSVNPDTGNDVGNQETSTDVLHTGITHSLTFLPPLSRFRICGNDKCDLYIYFYFLQSIYQDFVECLDFNLILIMCR